MPVRRRNRQVRVPPLNKGSAFDRAGKGVLGAVLPMFQRERLGEHMEYVIKNNPSVLAAVQANRENYNLLAKTVSEQYGIDKNYIRGSKLIDSWDRITSAGGLVAEAYLGPGQLVSVAEEVVELVPKALYGTYYALKTKDYGSLPYFALMEAASFIPFVGDLIDMKNIYVNRARERFRRRVEESFLEKLAKQTPPSRVKWN